MAFKNARNFCIIKDDLLCHLILTELWKFLKFFLKFLSRSIFHSFTKLRQIITNSLN